MRTRSNSTATVINAGSLDTANGTVGQSLEEERGHQGEVVLQAKVPRRRFALRANAITVAKGGKGKNQNNNNQGKGKGGGRGNAASLEQPEPESRAENASGLDLCTLVEVKSEEATTPFETDGSQSPVSSINSVDPRGWSATWTQGLQSLSSPRTCFRRGSPMISA